MSEIDEAAEAAWKRYAGPLADHPKVAGSKGNYIAGYTADKTPELDRLRAEVSRLTAALARFETEAARAHFAAVDGIATNLTEPCVSQLIKTGINFGRERLAGREGG